MADETPAWAVNGGKPLPPPPAATGSDGTTVTTNPVPGPAGAAPAPAGKKGLQHMETSKILRIMRIINFLNGAGMVTSAILQLLSGVVAISFQTVMLSLYVCLFGLMLLCAEMHFSSVDSFVRKRFGFLFSYIGRSIFILFAATINMAVDTWIGYLVGSITAINAIFNCYVIKMHPGFQASGLSATSDPNAAYTGGEEEMRKFMLAHPELAQKALRTGVSVAKSNPQLAAQGARVVVNAAYQPPAPTRGSAASDNPFDPPSNAV